MNFNLFSKKRARTKEQRYRKQERKKGKRASKSKTERWMAMKTGTDQ